MLFTTLMPIVLSLATFSAASPPRPLHHPLASRTVSDAASAASNVTADCPQATILAIGIAMNIVDQRNEQAALAQVKAALQQNPVDMATFTAAKANLLTFVNNGITIRQANQAIAPSGNPAVPGLQTVAQAQLTELSLAQGLTGNPSIDMTAVTSMEGDFAGGIVQNQKNQAAATAQCVSPPAPASTGTSGAANQAIALANAAGAKAQARV